ncbi:hypothetical protein Q5P01_006648 [Channa striata]|uniref:Uncharacterized protein n=1 Tax=Channa striata TaxID=64152 RepID=A0AA88N8C7_CHASR|nr:hypothetical protein Q5P01_006648 [Channa striata]
MAPCSSVSSSENKSSEESERDSLARLGLSTPGFRSKRFHTFLSVLWAPLQIRSFATDFDFLRNAVKCFGRQMHQGDAMM